MALSPEKMAEFLASELMDDIDQLIDRLVAFDDRWSQYGQQYQHLLTEEKRAELDACWQRFFDTIKGDPD